MKSMYDVSKGDTVRPLISVKELVQGKEYTVSKVQHTRHGKAFCLEGFPDKQFLAEIFDAKGCEKRVSTRRHLVSKRVVLLLALFIAMMGISFLFLAIWSGREYLLGWSATSIVTLVLSGALTVFVVTILDDRGGENERG